MRSPKKLVARPPHLAGPRASSKIPQLSIPQIYAHRKSQGDQAKVALPRDTRGTLFEPPAHLTVSLAEAEMPLARPVTIPRARFAATEQKANSCYEVGQA